MKKPFLWGCMAAVAASVTFPAWADTHTVASGETETLNNVTETSRFVKDGEGTLVLGGDNSFKRVTMSAGDLKISGGTTSISDTPGSGASDANSIFAMSGGRLTVADGRRVHFELANHIRIVTEAAALAPYVTLPPRRTPVASAPMKSGQVNHE